jgi:hypothetical protein
MKNDEARAFEFIAATVASFHGIFNAQVLLGNFERYWLYVASAIVGCFFFLLFKKKKSFPVEIAGVTLLLAYAILRFIYSLGIQLPGKGRDVLLPPIYSLAFGYVAATGAAACLVLFAWRFFNERYSK